MQIFVVEHGSIPGYSPIHYDDVVVLTARQINPGRLRIPKRAEARKFRI